MTSARSAKLFSRPLKILVALTFYRPHVSGLTIYVERLARGLVDRGHSVTILTSQHASELPRRETIDGVRIVRVPVRLRVSKGVLMPTYGISATPLVREHDILSVHLPQLDAWGLGLRSQIFRKPLVLTYHCDLQLPPGRVNRIAERVTWTANLMAGLAADRVVAYTEDYARHSRFLRRFESKIDVIAPPVVMRAPSETEIAEFRRKHGLGDGTEAPSPVIGLATRFAAEKGIDTLVAALPILQERFPRLQVLFAGPHENVAGELEYRARLEPAISALRDRWRFVGTLDPVEEMPAFFGALDCLLVPSVNSTESFGLVQVEAMLCGTPVVASNLPGVREPTRMTSMGLVVEPQDARGLAEATTQVLKDKSRFVRPREEIERRFDLTRTLDAYEKLFEEQLAISRRRRRSGE
jgi:glycosyltransferase involved in cell wall biosynthesis